RRRGSCRRPRTGTWTRSRRTTRRAPPPRSNGSRALRPRGRTSRCSRASRTDSRTERTSQPSRTLLEVLFPGAEPFVHLAARTAPFAGAVGKEPEGVLLVEVVGRHRQVAGVGAGGRAGPPQEPT